MNYKYALYSVIVARGGVRRIIAVDYKIYQRHIELHEDETEAYENYEFIGIIESDLTTEELLSAITEASESKAEYYRKRVIAIDDITRKTKL